MMDGRKIGEMLRDIGVKFYGQGEKFDNLFKGPNPGLAMLGDGIRDAGVAIGKGLIRLAWAIDGKGRKRK